MVTWIETTEDARWQTKPAPETGVASINGVRLTGVGYQWEGRDCIERTHKAWPELKLMQTESECGMGDNSWEYAEYIFHLVNHYLTHGALGYTYWNMVLAGTESTWGWHQNSLFSVDTEAKTFTRNPEYYVLRHYSHFVRPGARVLEVEGRFSLISPPCMAFYGIVA
ncbi:hypothetical protein [Bifidobacterium simiarum]|uniref:hypothetical protein n=1 Tax=Bifidobacterium simiarum TaxID=2045441 RepID=UPI001BDC8BF2|nr:hypothetical protein [Bifidobacterium simiarum]